MPSHYNTPRKVYAAAVTPTTQIFLRDNASQLALLDRQYTRAARAVTAQLELKQSIDATLDSRVAVLSNATEDLAWVHTHRPGSIAEGALVDYIDNQHTAYDTDYWRLQHAADATLAAYDEYDHTAAHRTRLEAERISKTAAEIEAIIKAHPLVAPKSRVGVTSAGVVTFTTIPIILRPDYNPYNFIDGGDIPYVALGKIAVCLHLRTGDIRFFRASRGGKVARAYYSASVHPHMMGDRNPCLGDFTSPISEACAAYDISYLLDVLSIYLHRAANDDPAGALWWKWLLADGYEHMVFRRDEPPTNSAGKTLSVTTFPDGRYEYHWRTPTLNNPLLLQLDPPVHALEFWDGRSIPKTGELLLANGDTRFAAWSDGKFYTTRRHPAYCNRDRLDVREESVNCTLLPILPDEYPVHYLQRFTAPVEQYHPLYWRLWDHGDTVGTYHPMVLHSDLTAPFHCAPYRAYYRPHGPMSRATNEPHDIADWDDVQYVGMGDQCPTDLLSAIGEAAPFPTDDTPQCGDFVYVSSLGACGIVIAPRQLYMPGFQNPAFTPLEFDRHVAYTRELSLFEKVASLRELLPALLRVSELDAFRDLLRNRYSAEIANTARPWIQAYAAKAGITPTQAEVQRPEIYRVELVDGQLRRIPTTVDLVA